MKDKELEILSVEIESDLEDLEMMVEEISGLTDDIRSSGNDPNHRDKAALGSFLHSFYNGIENILKRIAREVDDTVPKGEVWHKALLKRMGREVEGLRPAVLKRDTIEALKPYLAFRHFFRHSYSFEIDWNKLRPLIENVETVFEAVKRDLNSFFSSV